MRDVLLSKSPPTHTPSEATINILPGLLGRDNMDALNSAADLISTPPPVSRLVPNKMKVQPASSTSSDDSSSSGLTEKLDPIKQDIRTLGVAMASMVTELKTGQEKHD